jgi:hypothetical protein
MRINAWRANMANPDAPTAHLRVVEGSAVDCYVEVVPEDDRPVAATSSPPTGEADELPVVARMVVEIRSDGTRTVARGALEDRPSGQCVAVELTPSSPWEMAKGMAKLLLGAPWRRTEGLRRRLRGRG